jgi:hypothetical protein
MLGNPNNTDSLGNLNNTDSSGNNKQPFTDMPSYNNIKNSYITTEFNKTLPNKSNIDYNIYHSILYNSCNDEIYERIKGKLKLLNDQNVKDKLKLIVLKKITQQFFPQYFNFMNKSKEHTAVKRMLQILFEYLKILDNKLYNTDYINNLIREHWKGRMTEEYLKKCIEDFTKFKESLNRESIKSSSVIPSVPASTIGMLLGLSH